MQKADFPTWGESEQWWRGGKVRAVEETGVTHPQGNGKSQEGWGICRNCWVLITGAFLCLAMEFGLLPEVHGGRNC